MSGPSPICLVKNGSDPFVVTFGGVHITPGATIVIKLNSQDGVETWQPRCITADDLTDPQEITDALVIDPLERTATFTAPEEFGRTYRFHSVVNRGIDQNGVARLDYHTTFCLYALTAQGRRVLAIDETTEGGPAGWTAAINDLIRNPSPGSGEANTAVNVGGGDGELVAGKVGTEIRVRTIEAGANTTVETDGNVVRISATGGSSVPTGTGFRHVTDSSEDAAAKLVEDADVAASANIARSKLAADVLGADSVHTVTQKTINVADNTLTATSGAAGDLLVHDGSKFVRQAKGSNNTYWGVNGDGAVGYYAFPGGTPPGGSDTQVQWNNAGAFAGASGLTYHAATNRPDMPNGWRVTVGGQTGTFAVTPTGSRTITFQDATHTVVGRDTTDTLTNKTINASNNTITDTSAAQYDLLVADASGHFKRKAKGANNTYWGINGTGVADYYSFPSSASITGTDGEVVVKSGSNGVTATNVRAGTDHIGLGSGTLHTSARIRLPYNGGSGVVIIGAKESGGTDRSFLTYGAGDAWTVGNTDQDLLMRGWTFDVVVQSTPAVRVDTTKFGLGVPLSGSSGDSVPFRWKQATISLNSLASHTLTAAQYECVHLTFTGTPSTSPVEVYGPNTGGAFFILNNALSASVSLFFKVSGGTGLVVAANNKALTIHGGATQYDRLTADVA